MAKFIKSFRTIAEYYKYYLRATGIGKFGASLTRRNKLKTAHDKIFPMLNEDGYFVIENYASSDECNEAVLELKSFIQNNPSMVHIADDCRVFGVENFLKLARKMFNELDFLDLAELVNYESSYCAFSLGGWLQSGLGGSSGSGWHRDAFYNQFKAMLYLTDVTEDNGPFELLPCSQKLRYIVESENSAGIRHMQDRLTDYEVSLIESKTQIHRKKLLGKAGTLVVFNSSTIHRGSPIINGERLSITNYYFPLSRDRRSVLKQFSPIVI